MDKNIDKYKRYAKYLNDKNQTVSTESDKTSAAPTYAFYSKVLKEPFETLEELAAAEEAHYAKLKAKEDKANQKKADAKKVEEAFVALNAARKAYKDDLIKVTKTYSDDLTRLKHAFETEKATIKATLATAEDTYAAALKEFTDKYPEGYHLTLKDGDFETTISGGRSEATNNKQLTAADLFNWIFEI